ncbi:UDP-N-acetylmuramoylalanine--D-glutamate ligase [Myxococcaceae bacterium]|jgi:UDP-N-acetylmuramoylalanine--D-glutamate ligase|nr:UDP-N-acetylmuramoylalanine--D-glutamate ligase [Myxococcaceae bacterium]
MKLDLHAQRILVLGLGISGRAAVRFCAERGARVLAADERPACAIGDLGAIEACAELSVGAPLPDPSGFDLVVPSPGIAPGRYRDRARRVMGDLELAFRALSVPIVAITGTNGKSTTTRLVEAMLRAAGLRAEAAGNIGNSALDLVGRPLDVAVLEVSSFQLETVEEFRPAVSVILNVTPDHIDRHGGLPAYIEAKARILARQRPEDTAVLSADDRIVRELAARTRARVRWFSQREAIADGACVDAGAIVLREPGSTLRISLESFALPGTHNLENALAALIAAQSIGAAPALASRAFEGFRGLPHRTELVRVRRGVRWVNDSKGTNVGAALRSLESFSAPIVWIGGGKDKALDFRPLAPLLASRARAAILIGEAAPKLAEALAGSVALREAGTLERAVAMADDLAQPGDVVLLSPACASFDQFRSYEERGDRFRAAVAGLDEGGRR